jgi:hypothetical protein
LNQKVKGAKVSRVKEAEWTNFGLFLESLSPGPVEPFRYWIVPHTGYGQLEPESPMRSRNKEA